MTRPQTKSGTEGDSSVIANKYQPMWEFALYGSNALLESVEAPIQASQAFTAHDSDGNDYAVFQKVMVADGINFTEASAYMMTIIPTSAHYDISQFNHAQGKTNFSGIVLYHSISTGR